MKTLEEIIKPLRKSRNFEVFGYALDRLATQKKMDFKEIEKLAMKYDPMIKNVVKELEVRYNGDAWKATKLLVAMAWIGLDKIK